MIRPTLPTTTAYPNRFPKKAPAPQGMAALSFSDRLLCGYYDERPAAFKLDLFSAAKLSAHPKREAIYTAAYSICGRWHSEAPKDIAAVVLAIAGAIHEPIKAALPPL